MYYFNYIPIASFLLFVLLIAGKTFHLIKKGTAVSTKPNVYKPNKRFYFPVFIVLIILWIFEIIKPALTVSLSILPEFLSNKLVASPILILSGAIFIILSIILLLLTLVHFRRSLRFGMHSNNMGKLITTGVFSFSRNPFFVSIELYLWGIAIFLPSPFLVGFALLATISIHFFILKEEKFLTKNYGNEYEKYTKKVRRYL